MYSACGPQVDVFLLDEQTGALRTQEAVQSFALVNQEDMHKGNSQMDFGGLRHGGHVSSDEIQNDCMSLTDDALRYFAELRPFSRRNKVIRGGHVSVFSSTNGLDGFADTAEPVQWSKLRLVVSRRQRDRLTEGSV